MASQTPPPRQSSRTQMLTRFVPPSHGGRVAFLISCGGLIVLMALFTVMCAALNTLVPLVMTPGITVLSAIMAVVVGAPYVAVVLWLDRNEKEPPHLLASAFLWGAVMATGLSGLVNTAFETVSLGVIGNEAVASQLAASLSAPFIEELTKGLALAVVYLFFHREFDNVLDGIVYGAVIGLGFAVFENFTYYVGTGTVGGVLYLSMARGVMCGVGTHACFTAITGTGVGLFRVLRTGCLRWALPPVFLALAMFMHFSWNTFTGLFVLNPDDPVSTLLISLPLAIVVLQMPFVFLIVVVAGFTLWHERRLIERYLADEREPVLYEGELRRLVPARRRTLYTLGLFLSFQWSRLWRVRKRNRRLVKLAFERWHMDKEDRLENTEQAHYHALRVMRLRRELKAIPLD